MNIRCAAALLAAIAVFAAPLATGASDFQMRLQARAPVYDELLKQPDIQQLLREGRDGAVADRMIRLVPEAQRSAVDYFIVSNHEFRIDDKRSRELLMRAELLEPREPTIMVERGLHEHRRGDCAAAIAYYERAQKAVEARNSDTLWAYSTHCYLRLGRTDDALAAWSKVRFAQRHADVERGMYAVFGPPSPVVRRDALLAKVRAGHDELLCDLLRNDTHWEADWWNVGEHKVFADYDRELAQKRLEAGSEAARHFTLCDKLASLDAAAFQNALADLGIWDGAKGRLPASPALSRAVLTRLVKDKIADEAVLLRVFESPLQANLKAQRDTRDWAELLAYLYSRTQARAKLRKVDDYGWHQLHVAKFAESYVYGLAPDDKDRERRLQEALKEYPDSVRLRELDLQRKSGTPQKSAAMVQYVAAQFAHVAEPGEHRLHDYMASLRHELEESAAAAGKGA